MNRVLVAQAEDLKKSFDEKVERYKSQLTQINEQQRNIGENYDSRLQDLVDKSTDELEIACRSFEEGFEVNPAELKEIKIKFREEINPWYSRSYLMTRATVKPKGFPGDFELLEGIYNDLPVIDEVEGERSRGIGLYLDRWFLDSHLAKAVRNRKDYMKEFLSDRIIERGGNGLDILNLASGPCREWQELSNISSFKNVKLTCVDIDKLALDYVDEKLKGLKEKGLELITAQDNIIKMALRKIEDVEEKYGLQDIVYSIGLFDYLSNPLLEKMISKGYNLLRKDGTFVLAFKDKGKYQTTRYDWLTDWIFQPRNEESITKLLGLNGFSNEQIKISREPLNTIIFYEIKKR